MLFKFFVRNYIFVYQFLSFHVLMLELNDDVYQEVVKPLLKETRPQVKLGFFAYGPTNSPPKKRSRWNLGCTLKLIVIQCLVSHFTFHSSYWCFVCFVKTFSRFHFNLFHFMFKVTFSLAPFKVIFTWKCLGHCSTNDHQFFASIF
jgi:hypothetical protein